ncbi:hypothetical protein [Nonomuraea sp. NPDC049141]
MACPHLAARLWQVLRGSSGLIGAILIAPFDDIVDLFARNV